MPYLNRRTVRSLLARSRPSASPRPAEPSASQHLTTSTAPVKPESNSLPSSASAPVVSTCSSQTTSTRAVTADQGSSSPRSLPAVDDTAPPASPFRPDSPAAAEQTLQEAAAAFLEAGIPLASETAAPPPPPPPPPPPVFAPHASGRVPASDSPPYEFNGLFAVPTAANPPATPGAPPIYQPRAPEAEMFPQLPFTPFHRNAMAAARGGGGGGQIEHELPGDDRFPRSPGSRVVDGSWLSGRFEPFTVGGRTFFCPVHLLLRYPHWQLLLHLERPPHGWVLSPLIDASVFALVLETLVSPSGFSGAEPGLNLVKLALAARQAADWGMHREVCLLVASFRRYVARRVFYRNPHRPDTHGVMDHHYFVHRSEEIFRAWRVLSAAPDALRRRLPPAELVCLYTLAVPRDLWPALTAEFPDEFAALIDVSARIRVVPEEVDYHEWWLRFFRMAGCLDFDWMADVPDVLNMFFRSQQEMMQQEEQRAEDPVDGAAAEQQ
ncbi:hypothetical protein BB8028_0004g02120 [Beauveria bassiana]|uniref:Uncharacterized protein n=1 Tax=Beauveria bassiana TaxID=176275 RepID=A0A2S7YAS2_BEABA|nr:hypothetical protein BB8028_0004g02120 [Beauveria bassiana]